MKKLFLVSVLMGALFSAGCSSLHSKPSEDVLLATSKGAAKSLVKGLPNAEMAKQTPILVATVVDINNVEKTSALGRLITEHVRTNLANMGFIVHEIKLRDTLKLNESGEFLLSQNIQKILGVQEAGVVVVGTYAVVESSVLVDLKLVHAATGRILRGHSYSIPVEIANGLSAQ